VPVGLLCWPLAAALHSLTWTAFSWWLTPLLGSLTAVLMAIGLRAAAGPVRPEIAPNDRTARSRRPTTSGWSTMGVPVATLAAAAVLTAVSSATGAFVFTADSWGGYASTAMRLADTGVLFERIMSERAAIIPAMSAGYRAFGGEWLFTIYPLIALSVLAILAMAVLRRNRGITTAGAALFGSMAAVIGLAAHPFFLFHSIYIHSHMLTALYVLLGVVAVALASEDAEPAWLSVAGLAAAGIVLSRPDGLAYAVIPLISAGVIALRDSRDPGHSVVATYAPHLAVNLVVFGAAIVRDGLWASPKLSGRMAVALLALHAALGVAFWLISRQKRARDVSARHGLTIALGLAVIAAMGVAVIAEQTPDTARIMLGNLLTDGEWGLLWYAVPGILVISAMVSIRHHKDMLLVLGGWTVPMFLAAAWAVHASAHPGHLGWTDSFNRVAFHVVPVVFLCVGAIIAWTIHVLMQPVDGKVGRR
ncbi:MAG: hypothetical protein RBS17_08770, partial [Coriobacteriia bacterium]|nr:hypothetical protein [Coriobacteriia bacterium]